MSTSKETDYINPKGSRVTAVDDKADPVLFYPSGGGFQYSMPAEKFHEEFKPAPPLTWRRGVVTAEWHGYEPEILIPCWSDGGLWNGWGMPYFERAQVEQLIALQPGALHWDGDKVVATLEGADPEDGPEEYEPIEIEGVKVWGVGAGSWTWDRVEFDEKALGAELLQARYEKAGQHPVWTLEKWEAGVVSRRTLLGYWDWVVAQIEEAP